ncbi:phage repressor protein CI [Rosenbergiella collisarenosi]|uniref:phage repressor protein CI n=1 Tax=Rosenbergiella collisarenosi TaxID=1544695 RepID=UPI001F4F5AC1|nr:phage repressor protein CI [Rosenbergiella collisarenosi]
MSLQINFDSGGVQVLDRIIEAYGFRTKIALAEHLGIASSSLAMRYKRDYFPSDIAVRCMAETGVTLEWLATGFGDKFEDGSLSFLKFRKQKLVDGQLFDDGSISLDKSLFPAGKQAPKRGLYICDENSYLIECDFDETYDGQWLVQIDDKSSIRTLTHIPTGKVRVSGRDSTFDCLLSEIDVIGKVFMTIKV